MLFRSNACQRFLKGNRQFWVRSNYTTTLQNKGNCNPKAISPTRNNQGLSGLIDVTSSKLLSKKWFQMGPPPKATAPFLEQKALKTANSEKCVFRVLRLLCCLGLQIRSFSAENLLQVFAVLRNPFSALKNLRIPARRACRRLTRQPAKAQRRVSECLTRQPAEDQARSSST